MLHNTALNSFDNLPYYPADNHHSSDDVYGKEGSEVDTWNSTTYMSETQ